MAENSSFFNDKQFLLAYMGDYAADELEGENKSKYDTLITAPEHQSLLEEYQQKLGQLQLGLQAIYCDDAFLTRLRSFVVDPDVVAHEADEDLHKIGVVELLLNLKNRIFIIALAGLFVFGLIRLLSNGQAPHFNVLQAVHFEALAMMTDGEERLSLLSPDLTEIEQFFDVKKGLGYKPLMIKKTFDNYHLDGGSYIDYDDDSMAVIQLSKKVNDIKDYLFIFSTKGNLSDLTNSRAGNLSDGFTYQAYSTEAFNIVSWQADKSTLGIIVGRGDGETLANWARDFVQ